MVNVKPVMLPVTSSRMTSLVVGHLIALVRPYILTRALLPLTGYVVPLTQVQLKTYGALWIVASKVRPQTVQDLTDALI